MIDILKENKNIFIIAGIIFVVLFVGILTISLLNGNNTKSNLILSCNSSQQYEFGESTQRFDLYEYSDSRKFVVTMDFYVDEQTMEQVSDYIDLMKLQIENNIRYNYGDDHPYVQFDITTSKTDLTAVIEYTFTESNAAEMYEVLGMDLLNIDVEELETEFRSGGLTCD